jgi:glycosyltransferase involved in cell wall biosynthesis
LISIVIISKDEPSLDGTLTEVIFQARTCEEPSEIIVVDASDGRLEHIRLRHEAEARWIQFEQPPAVTVSIPHQRNAGVRAARGQIIVFTDAGCQPEPNWLSRLTAPLFQHEFVTAGLFVGAVESRGPSPWRLAAQQALECPYLAQCGSGNLAFRREVFDAIEGFDERFDYSSDTDFTWRIVDAGYRIRSVPDAIVRHDWGTWRRQLRRSYVYGKGRARLYRKHRTRLKRILRDDPIAVVYPAFLLGLPLTLIVPFYPAALLIPAWRNRSYGPVSVVVNHLFFGAGVLAELIS